MDEKAFIKSLQKENQNNCIVKEALKEKRDYVTPEDVTAARLTNDIAIVHVDALKLLAGGTGYGVEDSDTFAYCAISDL